jgi:hypothetical protein
MVWWNNENGLLWSGWRPWSSSKFHYQITDEIFVGIDPPMMIASSENLYPGPTACCLFSFPPLLFFAPCFCPLISMNSMAYQWTFYRCKDLQHPFCCQVQEKSFLTSEQFSLQNISSIEIIERHKAHTDSD